MIMYLLYKLAIFLSLNAPLRVAYKIAVFAADCQFFFSKKDRNAVLDNLAVIFGKCDKETLCIARSVFRNFAKYLVDFFRFSKIDDDYIKKYIKLKGIERVDNGFKQGKGVIIASAHLGNWELAGAIFAKLGYPLNVIALDHKNKSVNNIFLGQRRSMGMKVISIGMGLRRCFVALKKNEAVAVLGDRDFSTHGVNVAFFDRETDIPKGPAAFSLRSGAPIIPTIMLRNPDDTFDFIFEKPIEYQPTGDSEKDIRALTKKLLAVIEDYVRKYPEQWYLFRRFWD